MIVVFVSGLMAQSNPTDLFEFTIIDSLPYATFGTGLWYWGYGDVHLATNGQRIILAAKKTYKGPTTHQAQTHLLYGERQGFGKWNFENAYSFRDSLYFAHVKTMLMYGEMPIMFFHERVEDWSTVPNEFKFVNLTGTGWAPTVLATDVTDDNVLERYDEGFALSQGDDGATAYWFRAVTHELSPGEYHTKYVLVSQNWATGETVTIWESPYDESVNLTPVVTEDGEYVAISFHSHDDQHTYWGVRVFRKTSNGYVEEFADSTISDSGYDYLNAFGLAIGKEANGDILLIALGNLARPIYRRTSNGWTKWMDNFPVGSGTESYLSQASSRYLANERIQFSSNGTAFWGDMDGWSTYYFSAEISFFTPDGIFGHVVYPNLPGYQYGGAFEFHDFCITEDDTLHIVYNYKPSIENPPMYLVEGKLYIPDLLDMITGIESNDKVQEPRRFTLWQNYPNPFNPTTTIRFSIGHRTHVRLTVFDLMGRRIATLVDGILNAGDHTITFNAAPLPSGIYIYRLQAGDYAGERKMVLLK